MLWNHAINNDLTSLAEVASIALAIEMNSVASIALAIEMSSLASIVLAIEMNSVASIALAIEMNSVASIALAIEMNSVASIALAIEMNGSCNLSFSPGLYNTSMYLRGVICENTACHWPKPSRIDVVVSYTLKESPFSSPLLYFPLLSSPLLC